MKPLVSYLFISFILFSTGCILSKKSTDRVITKRITNDTLFVKEAAEFAVSITFEREIREFLVKDVLDKEMRRKMASLGSSVYITYKGGFDKEVSDSNVTFHTLTIFGVTEIIYDFAAKERDFENNTKNESEYYFVKLANRIYYRRRPIPMM